MRFEHEGISLWYGTPDAPAPGPGEAVHVGSDITITVGVRPIDASNKIEVLYRTNQGPTKSIAADWLRNDFSRRAQYFSARLPSFQAGDVVEYTVICRFAGRQVPSPEQAKHFASSFHVAGAEVKPTPGLVPKETPVGSNASTTDYSADDEYRVHGTVTDADGQELSYAEVTVWWQRIRERLPLATGHTSEEGHYHLSYRPLDDAPGKLLIVVEVHSAHLDVPLESPLTPAQPDLQIDLAARPPDQSEFSALLRSIIPLLEGLSLLDVVENDEHQDISFLAQETGSSKEQIMRVVVADRLQAAYDIPAAAFYAFLRLGVPAALPSPLLEASQGFTLIDSLVRRIGSLIFALTPEVQKRTLETAVQQQLVSQRLAEQIPAILEALQSLRTTDVLQQPYQVGKTTLGQLLDVAKLDKSKQEMFAKALVSNTQSMRNFWRTLGDGKHGFTLAEASAVQRTLEVGAFVKNHLPLVQVLLHGFTAGTYTSLATLARLSVQDWEQLVNQVGVPPNIEAAGTASPAEVFARVIYARVTRAYPTTALAGRITTGNFVAPGEREPLNQFFLNNPSLELGKINLPIYLEQQGDKAFTGIAEENRPAVIANAKRFQRVLRVIPEVDAAQALLSLGIHSATQIATMGRQQFFTQATAAGLTKREAKTVYNAGTQRYANLVSIVTQYNRGLIGIWPKGVGSTTELDEPMTKAIQRNQSLATLFGSQDYCATDNCTSVLSPAAYLCDLLLWLRNHPLQSPFPTALAALFDRRPDIDFLLLNCPNTETPLPYIDLVNELLEDAVSPPDPLVWKQTTWSAAELRAAPEYVNAAAYTTLAGASYPHTLPYDSPLDELRTYLQQSSVALWQLRQALLPVHSATLAEQASIAGERFDIDPHEIDLITNANFVTLAVAWNTANPTTDLIPVPAFLQASSITYDNLLELLEVVWVRGGAAAVTLQGVNDNCDISVQTLEPAPLNISVQTRASAPLDAGVLDRMHRFLRLWRHGGWKMWELDLLLEAPLVGNGVLDENALVTLFTFRLLQDATGLVVDQQLAFFQDIDSAVNGHRNPDGSRTTSLYGQIFLNPTVPIDADIAAIESGGTVTDPTLSHHLTAIQAVLQVSAADANLLFGLTNGQLTLDNLSLIYRVITLARVVKLPLADLQRIVPLTTAGLLGAAFANPAATLAFIQQVKAIQQSGFTIDALIYVLTMQTSNTGITQEQITNSVLPAVRAAIQQTYNEIYGSADPPLTILQRELGQLPTFADPTVLATAISIVNDTYTDTLANRNTFIITYFGLFMDPATAQADLAPLPAGLTPAQRQAAIDQRAQDVLAPLATYLTQTRVIATLAANLQLQNDVTALLTQQLTVPGTGLTLLVVLTDPSLIAQTGGNYTPFTPANFPNQYLAVQLLDKVGTVVRRLHLVKTDLSWLLSNAVVYGGLDLTQLPVVSTQSSLTIAALLTTSLLVKLDRLFSAAPASASIQSLYDLISGVAGGTIANEAAAQTALAMITGWRVSDIASLATAIGISFSGGDYTNPAIYDALRTLAAMLTATGASGAQLMSWGVAAPDETVATSAQGVLKSRYSNDDWLKVAPTMMDPIRERRSAALQAYLLAQRDSTGAFLYGDTNALFDHFLIDVQMSSCEVTTRVIQAYAAVQLFVERCLMGLEEPNVVVDTSRDDTWTWWQWMKRYRIWEANREVFLYPENWLIESQRPNRTEIFQKLEQEVHQNDNTLDYLETVALNYIDRLDEIAHLFVTGTCSDPVTGAIHVVARTHADPPRFYLRSFADGAWTGWQQIHLDIKAHQVVPATYRGRLCLFWLDVKVMNEPHQPLPAAQASTTPPSQNVAKYVQIGLNFSIFRNGMWAPTQVTKGKLFDVPPLRDVIGLYHSPTKSDSRSAEEFYTLKVQTPGQAPGFGASLIIDVFRLGDYQVLGGPFIAHSVIVGLNPDTALHLGRAVFDGRFNDLELRDLLVPGPDYNDINAPFAVNLLSHAQSTYGLEARPLLPLLQPDPNLASEPNLIPQAGALATKPRGPSDPATIQLTFTSAAALEQNVGPLLNVASVPFSVVGPDTDLAFDPTSYFFYQDNRRCYYVESVRYYQWGSAWLPVPPSNPDTAPFEVRYNFHRFYHPYTRLFWHQLAGSGFPALYDRNLQQAPDSVDPSYSDVFSFQSGYQPTPGRVQWDLADVSTTLASSIDTSQTTITVTNDIWVPLPVFYVYVGTEILLVTAISGTNNTTWTVVRGQQGTTPASAPSSAAVTPTTASQDRQFLDFSYDAAYSVYNWELFFHAPLYIAERLSQNQRFEDALKWFHFIFDPTRQGPELVPQRFWIPKPLNSLTTDQILQQRINELLQLVNHSDPTALAQVTIWQKNPFNPFLIADQRPVAYMKRVVMSYLDNLINWADNLFSTDSREALNEATLLYIIAAEILGPQPVAITPPQHADDSFYDLAPKLDAFANAMVDIENVMGASGGGGDGGGAMPPPQTFYFKIPPNDKLLGYWKTVGDRLFKLRHCQNIEGVTRQLALFDAPIDPGLLIKAQAAGVDPGSVLNDTLGPLPNYRFTVLYAQALDFVNALRAYGALLLSALEKSDAAALALLQQTTAQQLLADADQIFEWRVEQVQNQIAVLNYTLALAQSNYEHYSSLPFANEAETASTVLSSISFFLKHAPPVLRGIAAILHALPEAHGGATGAGGSPTATVSEGGTHAGLSADQATNVLKETIAILDDGAKLADAQGKLSRVYEENQQKAAQAQIQIQQVKAQLDGAQIALQVAQQDQANHQEQIDNVQKQIDFLTDKFTNQDLYDWMVGQLADTYFQSYRLAYKMCKQAERCYRYELGLPTSSFIQFGYWDSLKKGLLAGETLNHDLRRMQASYLEQNSRRFEISRYISLVALDPNALLTLLEKGACDFDLPESLFDGDYPGHYQRHLVRVSLTVVYPSPGKFDNVKGTLTLTKNSVRISTDLGSGYPRQAPPTQDPRFVDQYGAVPQKIVLGNAQDDPGLFLTAINNNLSDQRYLPFEGAGTISSWHLELPAANNEIDLTTIGDVIIHLYYTALDGGDTFKQAVEANNAQNLPTSGLKLFSAQNDFSASWQGFFTPPANTDQTLALSLPPSRFPNWTRGKTITVTGLTVLAVSWNAGNFALQPQAPLPTADVTLTPVAGVTEPNVAAGNVAVANTSLGRWTFKLRTAAAADFRSITQNDIGDVLLLVNFQVS
jgi:Tc toxin complex TcA C-terminal TcB-binding domain/ABC toxin N-terminal region/Neuraminidase-like domain/Salmonella virulence plasmid 28.1kDa A protein